MAPKKKITDKSPNPKAAVKRAQKPMKPSPKKVDVKIGSSVALALLQAEANRISPKQAKKLAKQTKSPNTVKKPVKKRTPVTKKYATKTTENQSVDDSVTPQKQLNSPVTKKYATKTTENQSVDDSVTPQKQLKSPVTKKCVKKTTEKHSVDDSVAPQKQLNSPVTKKCVKKTTEKHSVDDSVSPQKQLNSPVTKKCVKKTTEKQSVDDSVTPQKQLNSPVTKKCVKKTTEKQSVDDSVTPQKQLNSPVTKMCVKKTTEKHSLDDSVTPQKQLNSPVTKKCVKKAPVKHHVDGMDSVTSQRQVYIPVIRMCVNKTAEKHSVDDSVTHTEQLHTPVTTKYVNKTTEKRSVDDSVAPQKQLHIPLKRMCVNKTEEKHNVNDPVTPQEQLHIPVKRKCVNKTTEKHNVDEPVTPQEQLHSPVTRKYVSKTTEKCSVDDSETQQEQLHTPTTIKYNTKTTEVRSVDDSETVQEQKKKPGPKSRTLLQVMKKPATPVSKARNKPSSNKQQKSVESLNISQEIGPDNSSDIHSKEELAASDGCKNYVATPVKRPRGRPKGSTNVKSKILNSKEIRNVAPMVQNVLENPSPPQPYNRPNSVISNKSNLTWTKDISTESSITSGTTTSVTVTSNDCVHINKQPEQLHNPDQLKVKNDNMKQMYPSEISTNESSSSDSESSSSSSSSSDSELSGANTMPELNLSTSSLTPKSPLSDSNTDLFRQRIENINKAVEDFKADMRALWSHRDDYRCTDSAILKGLDPDIDDICNKCGNFDMDLEAMSQETNNSEKSVERLRTDFTEQNESEIKSLEDSRRLSYEDNHSETSSPEGYRLRQKNVHNYSEAKFAKPCLVRRLSAVNSRDTSINLADKQLVSNINRVEASPTDSFKTFTSDNYNYVPFDRTHDDEDALSLYAESISGMESSRLDSIASVSNVSLHDVYVPKFSPTSCMREKYVYRPTKIQEHKSNPTEEPIEVGEIISNNNNQEQEPGTKPKEISRACVSSSGSRAINKTALEDSNRTSSIAEEPIKRSEAQNSSQHLRPFSSYIIMNPVKSSLYRGYCFFYIASQCIKVNCRFPHVDIDSNTFKYRLASLNEGNLITEYLLISKNGLLMRKFCMLFIEECKRRTETRILFKIAIDIGLGFVEIDEDLRVEVLETTLLHLNTISLDECEDLLKFEHKDTMMCDVLLSCMANSQNFAQFKRAFVKLANLMCELKRPVDIQVASSILERVCILPGEDFLARGMLTLMENTDVSIFENSLACLFEAQLSNTDSNVHTVYLFVKKAALEAQLTQPRENDMHPATALLMPRVTQNGPQQTSPDSTNMENLPELLLPVNSAPRRFVEPTLPLWRKGGYNKRLHRRRRGRNSNRMPLGVYPMQWYVLHRHSNM